MKILLDTSILVAALVETHPAHALAFDWLEKVRNKVHVGFVSAHSLAELYAILTRLPVKPAISPSEAQELIKDSVMEVCEVVALTAQDYDAVLNHLANIGIIGGVVYDALIMYVGAKVEVDLIVTLNEKDFKRVYPELANRIVGSKGI